MGLSQLDASPRKHKKKRMNKKSPLLWVVGGVAFVAVLLGLVGYQKYRANATKDWPKTQGRIMKSSYQYLGMIGEGQEPSYGPDVTYEYFVGGNVYQGRRVYLYDETFPSSRAVEEFLEQFPPGKILFSGRSLGVRAHSRNNSSKVEVLAQSHSCNYYSVRYLFSAFPPLALLGGECSTLRSNQLTAGPITDQDAVNSVLEL